MTILLIISLVCFAVGLILTAISTHMLYKTTKRFIYEMDDVNERLYRLSEELHYMLDQLYRR